MKQNHASPEDSRQRTDEPVKAHHLAEIEQQLKRVQPRPPELDVDEIVRSVSEENRSIVLAEPLTQPRGDRSYYGIGMIAGSWVCGAIAGALVTFIVLGRSGLPEVSSDTTATRNDERPILTGPGERGAADDEVERRQRDEALEDVPTRARSESFASMMLLDQYYRGADSYGVGWPTLRAGNFARRQVASGSWRLQLLAGPMPEDWADTSDPGGDARRELTPRFVPAPPTTREQLLQELLNPNTGSIL